MTDSSEWRGRTGASWAEQWRRTDRSFAQLTERLLERSREFSFASVLDVGCGAGEFALALARGRPQCRVVGVDISPHLVEVARERGAQLRNLAFEVADAATWSPDAGFAPELLVSRHGVMFFDDPVAAFTQLADVATPGAGLMFSCFRAFADNPIFTEVSRFMPEEIPSPVSEGPGPFAFADATRVEAILGAAGWQSVVFEPFDFAMVVGGGADPVEDAVRYFSTIGPLARAATELPLDRADRLFDGVRDLARRRLRDGLVTLRAAAWIVTARSARA